MTSYSETLVVRFAARFSGLERGHGQCEYTGVVSGKGKHVAKHHTIHQPITSTQWRAHIEGTYSVGIVPIRDDGTCSFGAIDIDLYGSKDALAVLEREVTRTRLPLVTCRTKSGGAHLFLFLSEPTSAELVRGKLMEWAVLLGHSGVEVFPKQTRLAGPNDFGNWINIPYYAAARSTERYALVDGKALTLEQFLDLSDLVALSAQQLADFEPEGIQEFETLLEEAPPCLQTLAKRGFDEGTRNNGLFNLGVYLLKRFGKEDDWEQKLDAYNNQFMTPPLGHKEVSSVAKSLSRKTYEYKCKEPPIVSCCNRQICLARRWGVGGEADDPGVVFGNLVKLNTDPPLWIWDVDGARIELTTSDLKDQQRFHTRVIEVLNKWPQLIKPKAWAELVRQRLERVEVVAVPPDATQEGQMWSYLEAYCTGRAAARKREELLQYKPWTEDGRTHFSAAHFRQFLEQNRMRVNEKTLWSWLRKKGATHHFYKIKGRGINTWSVPSFDPQIEDFAVPRLAELPAHSTTTTNGTEPETL